MPESRWDTIIIGGGPAGIAAAVYCGRMGLETLLLEALICGGQVATAQLVENYPGFERITGKELAEKLKAHAQHSGAEIREFEEVVELRLDGEQKTVVTSNSIYTCKAVILAMGGKHRKLEVGREEEYLGRGVSYCATCDGPLFHGKRVAVVGGGNTAAMGALYLGDLAEKVSLIHRRDDLRADSVLKARLRMTDIEFLWNSEVTELQGDETIKHLRIRSNKTGEEQIIPVDAVFILIGVVPSSDLAKAAGVHVDKEGYVIVDSKTQTNIPGVFAAGDLTKGLEQIGVAVGEGITAATQTYLYIKGGWYGETHKT